MVLMGENRGFWLMARQCCGAWEAMLRYWVQELKVVASIFLGRAAALEGHLGQKCVFDLGIQTLGLGLAIRVNVSYSCLYDYDTTRLR